MPDIDTSALLRILGLGFMLAWAAVRLGYWKGWYWRTRGGAYAYLPLGVLFILYTYQGQARELPGAGHTLYLALMVLLAGVCVWWSARPPAFVKPAWIRWIELHPAKVRQAMAQAVEAGEAWEPHVRSQADVDAWAKSLRGRASKGR